MGLKVWLVCKLISLEAWSLDNEFKDACNTLIKLCHREFTRLYSRHDSLILINLAWLNHIVSGSHLRRCIKATTPVSDNSTLEAKLATKNILKQPLILRCIATIEVVVRCHNSPRLRVANSNLKVTKIYLAQGSLRDTRIVTQTVNLLIISTEVLE